MNQQKFALVLVVFLVSLSASPALAVNKKLWLATFVGGLVATAPQDAFSANNTTPTVGVTVAPNPGFPSMTLQPTLFPSSAPTDTALLPMNVTRSITYGVEYYDPECASYFDGYLFYPRDPRTQNGFGRPYQFTTDQIHKLCEVSAPFVERGTRKSFYYVLNNPAGPRACVDDLFKATYALAGVQKRTPFVDPYYYTTAPGSITPYDAPPAGLPLNSRGVTEACAGSNDVSGMTNQYLAHKGKCFFNTMTGSEYEVGLDFAQAAALCNADVPDGGQTQLQKGGSSFMDSGALPAVLTVFSAGYLGYSALTD